MVYLRSRFTQIRISKSEHHPTLPIRPISHVEPTSSDLIWLSTTNLRFGTVYYLARETVGTCSWPGQDLMLSSKGLRRGGVHVPLFPMRIYSCSLVPQKYIMVFPEIHFDWVPLFLEILLHVPLINKNIPHCCHFYVSLKVFKYV